MEVLFEKYEGLLGKPFKLGGRGDHCVCGRKYSEKKTTICDLCDEEVIKDGIFYDCYGLAMEVYRLNGIDLPEKTSVSDNQLICTALLEGKSDYIELPQPESLCIVALKVNAPFITHIGIVLEDTKWFIHILDQYSVARERLRRREKLIDGYFKYVGFNNNHSIT
jgi:hypothetical protein